jgi:hypothetical protein
MYQYICSEESAHNTHQQCHFKWKVLSKQQFYLRIPFHLHILWNEMLLPVKPAPSACCSLWRLCSLSYHPSGFGGLEVACCPLVPKFAGSNPARSRRIFQGYKILSTPSFGRGSKSRPVPCLRFAACKRTLKVALTRYFQAKFTGHFSPNSSTFRC